MNYTSVLQGTDMSAPGKTSSLHGGEMNPVSSLVTAIPNQGMLKPYEKIPIFFRFSPRY